MFNNNYVSNITNQSYSQFSYDHRINHMTHPCNYTTQLYNNINVHRCKCVDCNTYTNTCTFNTIQCNPCLDVKNNNGNITANTNTNNAGNNNCLLYNTYNAYDNSNNNNNIQLNNENKKHICKHCGKRFKYLSLLDRHITSHSTEKPFLCDYPGCSKRFQHKYYLNQHKRRTHNAIKRFKCLQCGKAFVEKCNLKIHIRTHTGEKPYQCQICLRRFSVKTNLDAHLRIHNNEKPFQCQICKKSFARKAYLTQHTRTHTGEKPFQCQFCAKRCSQIGDLKKHIRIHTGEKPYQCEICNKKFRYSSHLKSHSRKLHPNK